MFDWVLNTALSRPLRSLGVNPLEAFLTLFEITKWVVKCNLGQGQWG